MVLLDSPTFYRNPMDWRLKTADLIQKMALIEGFSSKPDHKTPNIGLKVLKFSRGIPFLVRGDVSQ